MGSQSQTQLSDFHFHLKTGIYRIALIYSNDCSIPNCHLILIESNFFNLLFALESDSVMSLELAT